MKKTILITLCILTVVFGIVGCSTAEPKQPAIQEAVTEAPPDVEETSEEPENTPLPKEEPAEPVQSTDQAEEPKKSVEKEQEKTEPQVKPESNPKPQKPESADPTPPKKQEEETPVQTAQPAPETTPVPEVTTEPEPAPEPTPELTPKPTPEPEPQMEVMGSGFNKSVLAGVNEVRAQNGNAPLKLDSGLCAKALAHAKEMAERGETFHSCGGAESVTGSTAGGKSIGIRSAGHATGLALDADRSRLGVGSVKIGGKQYTCVFAPRD